MGATFNNLRVFLLQIMKTQIKIFGADNSNQVESLVNQFLSKEQFNSIIDIKYNANLTDQEYYQSVLIIYTV